MKEITSKRLLLRGFHEEDATSMFATYCNDEEVCRYITWYPHGTVENTRKFLQDVLLTSEDEYAICLKEDPSTVIGCIGIVTRSEQYNEVGYVIGKAFWNQGYMKEALQAFLDKRYTLEPLELRSCHAVENPASGRVMEACGFVYTHDALKRPKFDSAEDDMVTVKYYTYKG